MEYETEAPKCEDINTQTRDAPIDAPVLGTVLSYDDTNGVGKIKSNEKNGLTYAVKFNNIVNVTTLYSGQTVQFDKWGKNAINVEPIRNQNVKVYTGIVERSPYIKQGGHIITNDKNKIFFSDNNCENCINNEGKFELPKNGEKVSFKIDIKKSIAIDIKRVLTKAVKPKKKRRRKSNKNGGKKSNKNGKKNKGEKVYNGFVRFFSENERGFYFGFITVNGMDDIYFDERKVIGDVKKDDYVKFVIRKGSNGRSYGQYVQIDKTGTQIKQVKKVKVWDTLPPKKVRKKVVKKTLKLGTKACIKNSGDNDSVNSEIKDNYPESRGSSHVSYNGYN